MTISIKTGENVIAIIRRRIKDRKQRRVLLLELSQLQGNESFRKSMKLIYDLELGMEEKKEKAIV